MNTPGIDVSWPKRKALIENLSCQEIGACVVLTNLIWQQHEDLDLVANRIVGSTSGGSGDASLKVEFPCATVPVEMTIRSLVNRGIPHDQVQHVLDTLAGFSVVQIRNGKISIPAVTEQIRELLHKTLNRKNGWRSRRKAMSKAAQSVLVSEESREAPLDISTPPNAADSGIVGHPTKNAKNAKNSKVFTLALNKDDSSEIIAIVPCINDREAHVTKEWALDRSKMYPGIDVLREILRATQWVKDNPNRQKTANHIARYLNGWLSRAFSDMQVSSAVIRSRSITGNGFGSGSGNYQPETQQSDTMKPSHDSDGLDDLFLSNVSDKKQEESDKIDDVAVGETIDMIGFDPEQSRRSISSRIGSFARKS